MLQLDGIRFARGDFILNASLSVAAGERVAVIGPSGGGKSTLLSLIAGFDQPDRGEVGWKGQNITSTLPGDRPVTMLFQDNNLFPHLTVETNVALGADPSARPSSKARREAIEALSRVGLSDHESRLPLELSGGQQSRVALARVLLTNREIVLLDEPFSALGPGLRLEMASLVTELLPTATVLLVTHDPEDARMWSSSVIFVENGTVEASQETSAFFERPSEAFLKYTTQS